MVNVSIDEASVGKEIVVEKGLESCESVYLFVSSSEF